MPKLWNDTVATHRQAVRDATLDATAALVERRGLASVTMSEIAEATGISRATLYKYFPDVEAILAAWHERHIAGHLTELAGIRDRPGAPVDRLAAVLDAYALIAHERHATELATLLHRGDHVVRAQQHLHDFISDLIDQGVAAGALRHDIASTELASFCLHALTAASGLSSKAAVHRLVAVTLAGMRKG